MNCPISDPEFALRAVEIIAAVSVLVSSVEYLARPQQFSDGGLLSWTVSLSRSLFTSQGLLHPLFDILFSFPNVLWLIRLRLAAATVLLIPHLPPSVRFASCLTVFLLSALLALRSNFGNDGADQMSNLIFGALVLADLHPTNQTAKIALWFIAAQAALSYVTSGSAKLTVRKWRSGEHLTGVFRTSSYGHPLVGRSLMRNPKLAACAANAVIVGECTFPVVFVLPLRYSLPWLIGGLGFHVGAAMFMGLDTFFWSFAAAYPAILNCALRARGTL